MEIVLILLLTSSAHAADYFVDATHGNDSSLGTEQTSPWKTLSKINSSQFKPGDNIFFKRGETWEQSLIIPSSGTAKRPITFTAYGQGPNPLFKCTTTYSDWTLINAPPKKIWKGTGIKAPQGALKDGTRIPQYIAYEYTGNRPEKRRWSAPLKLNDMQNGFFYAPEDNRNAFYLRWDQGPPGVVEIGKRKYGIHIKNKKYVTIDSIDILGPGGEGWSGTRQITIDNSDNIYIANCRLSHHDNGGIIVRKGSTNCTLDKIKSYGHRNTGLYFWEAGKGNKAINCEVYQCGTLQTDYGDMGLIGVWKTPGVLIEGCYVHDNGHKNIINIDAAISFVQSTDGRVKRCTLKNAGGTAIQFAEASDNGLAAYNIIDGWGTYNTSGNNEGIRIGGGIGPTARNCRVFNNLFINGGKTPGRWAALRVLNQKNEGLQVKNNIFYNNLGIYEIIAESKEQYKNWHFSHNVIFRTEGYTVEIAGKRYDHQHILGDLLYNYPPDNTQEKGSLAINPEIDLVKMILKDYSPCIDKGTYVGLDKDFHGKPVPFGDGVDIGPFEFQGISTEKKTDDITSPTDFHEYPRY